MDELLLLFILADDLSGLMIRYKYNSSYKCCHIIMNSIFDGTSIIRKQSFALFKSTLLDYGGKFLPSLFISRWEY